jgi:hypothetical protein
MIGGIGEYQAFVRVNGHPYLGIGWTRAEAVRNLQQAVTERNPLHATVMQMIDIAVEPVRYDRRAV